MSITFREFVELIEGKKPPNAVPGTYNIDRETGDTSYTLKPANPNKTGPFTKSKLLQSLKKQGGIGAKAVKKGIEQRETELKKLRKKSKVAEGFSIKKSQEALEKKRKEAEQRKKQEAEQRREQLYRERVHGDGMVSYEKDGSGVVRRGRRKDGKFTPDADT